MTRFGTAGIRGSTRTDVTPALALSVGRAAAEDGAEFVVGRDGRVTGPGVLAAVEAGLTSGGADVVRVGRVPTPALAYASRGRRGVMVTASHNPPGDNGLKLFVDGTAYDRDHERAIESRLEDDPEPVAWDGWGVTRRADVLAEYRHEVVEYVQNRVGACDGLGVALDCGNGVGALAAPRVLDALGANVASLAANVDGHFPERASKPTAASLGTLRGFVADDDAIDLGVGLDGDGDRVVVVEGTGDVVHEDTVLAIVAGHYVETSDAADPVVVTTPNASDRVDRRVEAAGGRVERVRLGALHEGVERVGGDAGPNGGPTVVFAAEPWKHLHPGLGGWIDGVASTAVIAALVAAIGLASLRDGIDERPARKACVDCPDARKSAVMTRLRERLPAAFPDTAVATEHGIRLSFPDGGWVLVRPSGTEPVVRIYAESETVDALLETVRETVEAAVEAAED